MEQAAYRASAAALRFKPPDLSLLDHPKTILCAGKGAALVRFFAEPQRLFAAIRCRAAAQGMGGDPLLPGDPAPGEKSYLA